MRSIIKGLQLSASDPDQRVFQYPKILRIVGSLSNIKQDV